ncbi:MAG: hypothetical protein J6039_03570 [Alphaproteobacteria bacterium]|nr:hypothetical protein [Alphaproteobacteria bacterium]
MQIFDRAGFEYTLVSLADYARKIQLESYVTFEQDGTPVVIRNGKPAKSTFFTDGNGKWASLINSSKPEKVEKALKKPENPAIVLKDGKLVCQWVPMIGIKWHDDRGRIFFLISKWDVQELEADGLGYITAESDGTYENIRYIANDGTKEVEVPNVLYNERNKAFKVGVNVKAMAYSEMRKRCSAGIFRKNAGRPVYARKSETGELIMAHTFGAYEAAEVAKGNGAWLVDYVEGGNGGWEVSGKEFLARYEFAYVAEDGRAVFMPTSAKSVWVHLLGNYIFCIPQWGDSMVAMTNPQINVTNPDDVYACSYIEFYGTENVNGAYELVKVLYLGAPEPVILEFQKTLEGYVNHTFGIPKSAISASNLSAFLKETMGVPAELEVLQSKVKKAI